MNKADLSKHVFRVIPVNHNGNPDSDGGLAGACWRNESGERWAYINSCDEIKQNGFAFRNDMLFIDTMDGLDTIKKAFIGIEKQDKCILLMPPIGCGIAGYSWDNEILPLIEKHLQNHDVIFVDK